MTNREKMRRASATRRELVRELAERLQGSGDPEYNRPLGDLIALGLTRLRALVAALDEVKTRTLLIWGDDDTSCSAFASLLDDIRRGDLDGEVVDHDPVAVDYALAHGAPEEWESEWALAVTASPDTLERIAAAADATPGVRAYGDGAEEDTQ